MYVAIKAHAHRTNIIHTNIHAESLLATKWMHDFLNLLKIQFEMQVHRFLPFCNTIEYAMHTANRIRRYQQRKWHYSIGILNYSHLLDRDGRPAALRRQMLYSIVSHVIINLFLGCCCQTAFMRHIRSSARSVFSSTSLVAICQFANDKLCAFIYCRTVRHIFRLLVFPIR